MRWYSQQESWVSVDAGINSQTCVCVCIFLTGGREGINVGEKVHGSRIRYCQPGVPPGLPSKTLPPATQGQLPHWPAPPKAKPILTAASMHQQVGSTVILAATGLTPDGPWWAILFLPSLFLPYSDQWQCCLTRDAQYPPEWTRSEFALLCPRMPHCFHVVE